MVRLEQKSSNVLDIIYIINSSNYHTPYTIKQMYRFYIKKKIIELFKIWLNFKKDTLYHQK